MTINLIFLGVSLGFAISSVIASILFMKADPRRWAPASGQNLHDHAAMEDYFKRYAVVQKRIGRRSLIVGPSIFITIGLVRSLIVQGGAGALRI